MGDILRAYDLLNRTFRLGLTKQQLFRAEALFKFDFSAQEKFRTDIRKNPEQLMAEWEFRSYLVPRTRAISQSARTSMRQVAAEVAREVKAR